MTWNSFDVETGGGEIRFMISLRDNLLIGTGSIAGVVDSIHEMKRDSKTKEFKLKGGEVWHRRSKTPLFERIALQFKDIIDFLKIDKNDKEKIIAALIEMALDLSKAEEGFLEYVETEDAMVAQYEDPKGIIPQKNALVYKHPTLTLKEIAERVLIRVIIAYRKLPEVISLIRGETFKPGKTFLNDLVRLLPTGHPDRKSFEYDNNWIKELYDLRGDIEHESWEILPFEVHQVEGTTSYHVERCRVVVKSQGEKPITVGAYLNVTLYNMITFIEEMVALALFDKMPYPTRIIELPEAERSKRNHYRYVPDLVPEMKEKLPDR